MGGSFFSAFGAAGCAAETTSCGMTAGAFASGAADFSGSAGFAGSAALTGAFSGSAGFAGSFAGAAGMGLPNATAVTSASIRTSGVSAGVTVISGAFSSGLGADLTG